MQNLFDFLLESYRAHRPQEQPPTPESFVAYCRDYLERNRPTNALVEPDGMVLVFSVRLQSGEALSLGSSAAPPAERPSRAYQVEKPGGMIQKPVLAVPGATAVESKPKSE